MQVLGLVEESFPTTPVAQTPDFVRPCAQATYCSPHTSLVHQGEY